MDTVAAYILIIVFHIDGGSAIAMQEFNSEESCKNTLTYLQALYKEGKKTSNFASIDDIRCMPK